MKGLLRRRSPLTFVGFGLDVEMQEVAPGRPNVVGVLEGRAPGPSLMFCGHLDTVGTEGMVDPFNPVVRDGRLYGRGAQDMKGGVAAMIDAARIIAAEGLAAGRLIVAAVIDEEYESLGADALVTRWSADAAVVTEPTDLEIAIGHKGFAWFEVETRGRRGARQPPARGTRRDHANGPGAAWSRRARIESCNSARRIPSWASRRSTRR